VQSLDEVLRDENMSTEERWEAVALQFEIDKLLLRYANLSLSSSLQLSFSRSLVLPYWPQRS
jgi:hypothetical protein